MSGNIYVLTLIIIIILFRRSYEQITIPIDNILNVLKLPISFEDKRHIHFFYRINLQSSDFFVLLEENYFEKHSASFTISECKKIIKVQEVYTKIKLKSLSFPLTCYLVFNDEEVLEQKKGIPFGYQIRDESFSPIFQLKKAKLIDKMAFGLSFADAFHAYMHFGGFPSYLTQSQYSAKCPINNKMPYWGCPMSKMYMSNQDGSINRDFNFDVNEFVFFQTTHDNILAPISFMEKLKVNYFNQFLDSGECQYNNDANYFTFSCKCHELFLEENINFIFNGISFSLPIKSFFHNIYGKKREEYCDFLIKGHNRDQWEFGTVFLKRYTTLFDYENKEILFYSYTPFHIDKTYDDKSKMKLFIMVGIMILNLCSMILILGTRKFYC